MGELSRQIWLSNFYSGVGPWTAEYFSNWRFYPGTNGDENNMRGRQIRASNAWVSQGVQTSSCE